MALPGRALLLGLLIVVALPGFFCFKEHDFKVTCPWAQPTGGAPVCKSIEDACVTDLHHCLQKCKDASFCQRNRGVKGTKYKLEPGSITLEAGTIKGIVLKDDGAKLNLTILAYESTIRVLVDELPSVDRYQVPDILQPSLKQAAFTDLKPLNKDVWVAQLGDYKLKLTGSSFKLEILSNEKPVIIFNNRHMFNFEQRRQKKASAAKPCVL